MNRVLVVDDEPQIRRALSLNLRARGYAVLEAGTGEAALQAVATEHPDLVLLDLGLPKIDGFDVIEGLRGWTKVPIIVLTVREDERSKVRALDLGRRRLRHEALRHGRAAGPPPGGDATRARPGSRAPRGPHPLVPARPRRQASVRRRRRRQQR